MRLALVALSCLLLAAPLAAELLNFDSAEEWALWQKPFGLTQVGPEGQLQLVKFRKDINLTQDAHLFTHDPKTRGDDVPGGLWQAGAILGVTDCVAWELDRDWLERDPDLAQNRLCGYPNL